MNSHFFSKIIEERGTKCANVHIGMIIKKRRKEMNLTLEEATKGICCVSYLSKLEHGIIEPKRYVMEEVLERLDVSKTALRATKDYDRMINVCISCIYFEKYDEIYTIYDSLASEELIHFTDVISAFYSYINDNYDEALQKIQRALDVKEHLDDVEIAACVLLSSLIRLKRNDFYEAVDQALTLNGIYLSNIEANKLKCKIIITGKFMLGEYGSIFQYIDSFNSLCSQTLDFEGIKLAKYYSCMTLASSGEESDAMRILDCIRKSLGNEEYHLWSKNIYLLLGQTLEASKFETTTIEKIWIYDSLKEGEKVKELLDNLKYDELTELEKKYIDGIKKKYLEDKYFYILYLRDLLYPYVISHGYFVLARNIRDILLDHYLSENKYREGLRVLTDFEKIRTSRWKK